MYGTKEMARDSKRSLAEYRARQFTKKHFILGRIRQKGDEKPITISCFMATIGAIFLTATLAT